MKGVARKTRKGKCETRPADTSDTVSQGTEESNAVPGSGFVVSEASPKSFPSTPKRRRRQARQTREQCLTSTPVHNSTDFVSNVSKSCLRAKQVEQDYTELITQLKAAEVDSPGYKSVSQSRRGRCHGRSTNRKTQACSKTSSPSAKGCRGRKRKIETGAPTAPSLRCSRPRFTLEELDAAEQDVSSELSIELSHHEEQLPSLSFEEDEESEEEEEELPSFLKMDKKPLSISEGMFVWHKMRNFPFWPALVKSVHRKQRKASILFIDDSVINKKKGFTVPLKTLKPFDCEDDNELECKAKEQHTAAIKWSLDLIEDYRIKIACGSFSGSFIEYLSHDMSYPVRKKYPQADSERLTIESDEFVEVPCDDQKVDSVGELQEDVSKCSKRLLPDRSHAAHNRANEKLVHFIVRQRMVEDRLLAVIHGQEQSRWLRSFLTANQRRIVNTYLEDDHQLDQVYCYLTELYTTAVASAPRLNALKSMERVPFVLDVLLPEAIIYAIAGVDKVSIKKAEEKYLRGRCISNRERQEFELMIERQMKRKFTAS